MIALAGLPLVLLVGALADVTSGLLGRAITRRGSGGGGPLAPFLAVRRRGSPRQVGSLQAIGAVLAGAGAGIVGAAALGAVPGPIGVLALSLVAASVGLALCRSDAPSRSRAAAAASDLRAGLVLDAVALVALVAAFLRWRVPDLEAARGAQAVLGPGLLVGTPLRAGALALAVLALAVAGGARAGHPDTQAPGRSVRAEESLLLALCRWSVLGSVALVGAALVAGPAIAPGAPWGSVGRALPAWVLGSLVSGLVAGAAARTLGSSGSQRSVRLVAAPALVLVLAVSVLLASR